ncbi:MAG: hydratase [Clostridia bacterium]|nr:hydratase [Clostridia bacterium]
MVKITSEKCVRLAGDVFVPADGYKGKTGSTIAEKILSAHNLGDGEDLRIRFDALASHDITYVGIIQTARAGGLKEFPVPYVLTNCHNSLCAVGGTINEDDHLFGLSAAKKYGGIYVPAHQAVIHSFMRERYAFCGGMILGSDSHTRYGALGTLGVGEGGPELVKQLLRRTYDVKKPGVVAVKLTGKPRGGIGPHDVAIALIGAVFGGGIVKNKILEFVGEGVSGLSVEFRNGIDVMTTETACLSSVWVTDEKVKKYFEIHGRPEAYRRLEPDDGAVYDALVEIDLSSVESMIALPFHPSNAVTIRELKADPRGVLSEKAPSLLGKIGPDGNVRAEQGVIAGCAGGIYENLVAAKDILSRGAELGDFTLSVYPASQPVLGQIMRDGTAAGLISAGAILKTAFCGPCFGAGDVPGNGCLSLRHTTRNFPNREGSKPGEGQEAFVALCDARTIAATAANGGVLTGGDETGVDFTEPDCVFDSSSYGAKVYDGFGKAKPETELRYGPNIADWPEIAPLRDDLLLTVCSVIKDPVTTTDELIPSGETSSYRSNPYKLAEFTLSRRDPGYVSRAKAARDGDIPDLDFIDRTRLTRGSVIYATKPGDGSAREQAASCQRVLGGAANVAVEYATKRYRSNLINWGMIPFTVSEDPGFSVGDYIFIKDIRAALIEQRPTVEATVVGGDGVRSVTLIMPALTGPERETILCGCLVNYYNK